jgi:hypothetical protein
MIDDRDLVTRLREYRMDVDSPDVVREAADEIERLRDFNAFLVSHDGVLAEALRQWDEQQVQT